jgi:hypothetical protein
MKENHGRLEITSDLNQGTTIKLLFDLDNVPDIILVEDDELVRLAWQARFSKTNLNLKTFSQPEEFLKIQNFKNDDLYFIDSEYEGSPVKGSAIARRLFEEQCNSIYMCSGHPADYFKELNFLKGVISKRPFL